jgi:hypothetical protein
LFVDHRAPSAQRLDAKADACPGTEIAWALASLVFRPGASAVQDTAGFTSITISVLSGANAAFSMDDLRFSAIGVVPEPESVALIGAGLLAYSLLRRRQSRKAA